MSSGSWMMPRPSSQDQTRLAMLRVNQGFFGAISQSAKTSRGSWSAESLHRGSVGKRRHCHRVGRGRVGRGGIEEDDLLLPLAGGLVADLREERRHAGQLIVRPLLRPRAHERQRHGLGDAARLRFCMAR